MAACGIDGKTPGIKKRPDSRTRPHAPVLALLYILLAGSLAACRPSAPSESLPSPEMTASIPPVETLSPEIPQAVPQAVVEQITADLSGGWMPEEWRLNGVTFVADYTNLADSPVEVYQADADWRQEREGTAVFTPRLDENFYYFFAKESGGVYTSLGGRALLDGNMERTALAAAWRLIDPEYAVRREGCPGWYGLGGMGAVGTMDAPGITERLPDEAIYSEGGYWSKTTWEGLTIECWNDIDREAGTISSMTVTRPDLETWRGISVGDSRTDVLAIYPEASAEPQWDWEGDFLWIGQMPDTGLGCNLVFYFDGDTVSRMELLDIFD